MATFPAFQDAWFQDADPTDHNSANNNRDVRNYQTPPPAGLALDYLFYADPFISKSANAVSASNNVKQAMEFQTRQAALASPIFVRGCSQFIVEFAGDFYDQGPVGGVPEAVGTIDYVPDPANAGLTRIRWYGLPRDVDGTPGIQITDVNLPTVAPPPGPTGPVTPRFNTASFLAPGPQKFTPATPSMPDTPYIWGWSRAVAGGDPIATSATAAAVPGNPNNVRPKLIRITMELIDANGRLQDGQRIEYVFALR